MEERLSPRRWIALICILLMHAAMMGSLNQVTAFPDVVIGQMGASDVMFTQIALVSFLTGAIFAIPMGMLADKYGVVKIMGIGLAIAFVASIGRAFAAYDVTLLYLTSFIMGFGLAGLNANSVKFLRAWFGFTQMTTAMGIYVAGAGIGCALGLATASMFPSMQMAFVGSSVFILVCLIIWLLFARLPEGAEIEKDEYSAAAVKSCLSNRVLMLTSLAMIFAMCVQVPYMSLSTAGLAFKGLDPASAAQAASLINLIGIPASFIWGGVANKSGRLKVVLSCTLIASAIVSVVAWVMDFSDATLPLLLVASFLAFGPAGIIKSCVGLIPSIKPEYMGTAGGIQTLFQNLGAFIIPSFVMAPLAGGDYTLLFTIVAVMMVLCVVTFAFIPELGSKGKVRQQYLEEQRKELEA